MYVRAPGSPAFSMMLGVLEVVGVQLILGAVVVCGYRSSAQGLLSVLAQNRRNSCQWVSVLFLHRSRPARNQSSE